MMRVYGGFIVDYSVDLISEIASFISHDQIFVAYEQRMCINNRRVKCIRM